MDLVSIIIPTLNEEKNIDKTIKSLHKQTYKNLEIIVVDGGSTDNTFNNVVKFKNVKWLKTRTGNPKQRNFASTKANGKYIFFFDADVVIKNNFIEKSLQQFNKRGLDIACPLYFPTNSSIYIKMFYVLFNFIFILVQKISASGAGSCIIIKKDVFVKSKGFNINYKFDDIEFIRRVSKKYNFGMLYQVVYVSPRRFKKYGFLKTVLTYLKLSYYFIFEKFKAANKINYGFGEY